MNARTILDGESAKHFVKQVLPKQWTLVYNREGTETGTVTGRVRWCSMDGCTGTRMQVKWPDGKHTWPCTHGLTERDDMQYQIR